MAEQQYRVEDGPEPSTYWVEAPDGCQWLMRLRLEPRPALDCLMGGPVSSHHWRGIQAALIEATA
jgi:hypothetical protein